MDFFLKCSTSFYNQPKIKNHGNEVFIGVGIKNQRIYMNPVRDEQGKLIGYFERYELNLAK